MNKLKAVIALTLALGFLAIGASALTLRAAGKRGDQPQAEKSAQHDGAWDLSPPTKEPKYQKEARYALLVFGAKRTRVWMVLDGTTLYVDRNGNGDLTEGGSDWNLTIPRREATALAGRAATPL